MEARKQIIAKGLQTLNEIVAKSTNKIIYLYKIPNAQDIENVELKLKIGGSVFKDSELKNQVDLETVFASASKNLETEFSRVNIESNTSPTHHYGYSLQYDDKKCIYTTLTKNPYLRTNLGPVNSKQHITLYKNINTNSGIKPYNQYETPFIYSNNDLVNIKPTNSLNSSEMRGLVVNDNELFQKTRNVKFALCKKTEILTEVKNKKILQKTIVAETTDIDIVSKHTSGLLKQKIDTLVEAREELKNYFRGSEYETRLILNALLNCPQDHDCFASHIDTETGCMVHVYTPQIEYPQTQPSSPIAIDLETLKQLFPTQ